MARLGSGGINGGMEGAGKIENLIAGVGCRKFYLIS